MTPQNPGTPDRAPVLLTAVEVAALLGLKSPRTVYKMAKRHRWGFQRYLSRSCVRYDRRGLIQWISRRPKGRVQGENSLDAA